MKVIYLYRILLFLFGSIALLCPSISQAQVITTIAGNGVNGFSGDGGSALGAALNRPYGIVYDAAGNLYFSDISNNRIRKVSAAGTITTIAGNGLAIFSGDSVQATATSLNNPSGIAFDTSGNLYIADCYNNRIRKIDTSGIIVTIAGNGSFGFSGDGGPATAASLYLPTSVAPDSSGNIYIADNGNARVRKISPTGIITTVAGNGVTGYTGDGGMAIAAELHTPAWVAINHGNIYIADFGNARIRKVGPAGIITTVAGDGSTAFSGDGGPATAAGVYPSTIFFDSIRNMYIGDNNNRVRKIDTNGIITTIAGNGIAGYSNDNCAAANAMFHTPLGIVTDHSGRLCIADYINNRIRRLEGASHPPAFTGGHIRSISVCENIPDTINGLLAITDADTGQSEIWSLTLPAAHGVAIAADSQISTGGILTPSGLLYTPATGYTGNDSFKARVTDCTDLADSVTIYVTIANCALATPFQPPPVAENILSVVPNPGQRTFTVNLFAPVDEEAKFAVTDITGVRVIEADATTNHPATLLLDAPRGMYILSAITAHGTWNRKIVVSR